MAEANFVPAVTDVKVVREDTALLHFPVQTESGASADLTGYTVSTEIRQPTLENLTPASSINGSTITVSITSDQTETVEDGSRITTTITNADSSVARTVVYGRIFIITKDA